MTSRTTKRPAAKKKATKKASTKKKTSKKASTKTTTSKTAPAKKSIKKKDPSMKSAPTQAANHENDSMDHELEISKEFLLSGVAPELTKAPKSEIQFDDAEETVEFVSSPDEDFMKDELAREADFDPDDDEGDEGVPSWWRNDPAAIQGESNMEDDDEATEGIDDSDEWTEDDEWDDSPN